MLKLNTTLTLRQQFHLLVLFLSQALFTSSTIVAFTLTSIIATQLGGSEAYAGVPSTVTLLGRAAIAYPMGVIMARWGRKPGLLLGYLLGITGAIIAIGAIELSSFTIFILSALFFGFLRGTAEQIRFAAADVVPPQLRGKAIGLIVFAGTAGSIFGPTLVAQSEKIGERFGTALLAGPFLVSAFLITTAFFLTLFFLQSQENTVSQPTTNRAKDAPAINYDWYQELKNPKIRAGISAMIVGQVVMGLLMLMTPIHVQHLGFGTPVISRIIMVHTLGMFGLAPLTGWLIDRISATKMISYGALLLATACLLIMLSSNINIIGLALFTVGLGWNFCYVSGSSILTKQTNAKQLQGASETMVAIASGLSSLGIGIIYAQAGIIGLGGIGLLLTAFVWLQQNRIN